MSVEQDMVRVASVLNINSQNTDVSVELLKVFFITDDNGVRRRRWARNLKLTDDVIKHVSELYIQRAANDSDTIVIHGEWIDDWSYGVKIDAPIIDAIRSYIAEVSPNTKIMIN